MPTFRYTATDADGQPVLGTLDASGIDEARSELIGKGLRIESLADQTFEKISSQQAKDVGQYIADLTQSSLPVSEGLRQLSYELAAQSMWPSKTARILTSIADRLDAGESLTDVMTAYKTPRDLHAIITAGTKTGRTPEAVGEHWDQITAPVGQEELQDAFSQTKKYAKRAAKAHNFKLDW